MKKLELESFIQNYPVFSEMYIQYTVCGRINSVIIGFRWKQENSVSM